MIKKILIGIVTAGMILITIPTVNAEDEITLNEVTDQIIDISDKYNSAGITSGQLLNLITLTQTDDELLDTLSLDKNNLFDTSKPKKVNNVPARPDAHLLHSLSPAGRFRLRCPYLSGLHFPKFCPASASRQKQQNAPYSVPARASFQNQRPYTAKPAR